MQSLRRAVGKSIKSCYCLREIKSSSNSYEFQQLQGLRGFRSTSSSSSFLLLNNIYPKIGVHSIYGRSFSSRPSGDDIIISGGEASKVPLVEQLFDSDIIISGGSGVVDEVQVPFVEQLFDYVTFPVGCTLVVGMIIAFSLSRRLLISWLVKRPDPYLYQNLKYYSSCLFLLAACICTPDQDSLMDMIIIISLATGTHKAIAMLLDEVDKLEARLSLPFSVGDTIKIIKIGKETRYEEFKVLGICRTFTTLLSTAENCELYVPNSNISEQTIVRSIVKIIQLKIDDVDKIPRISEDITSMLKLNPNVCLEMEVPYCSCAQERSHFELTLKYDLILEDKESENDVLINVAPIIKKHGGESISNPIQSYPSIIFGRYIRNYTYF